LALTGESLPVDKKAGDDTYSGSIAKQGEMDGVVTATGMNTYFGKRTSRLTGRCYAIPDRIIHNAYRIELAGESMRKHRMLEPST